MKISITCEKGWILLRMAEELKNRLKNHCVYINEEIPDADINYYVDSCYYRHKSNAIDVGFFTHFPNAHADIWMKGAKEMECCIVPGQWSRNVLIRQGIPAEKISVVALCADARFVPKVRLGIAGRVKPGGGSGDHLVKALLQDVDFSKMVSLVAKREGWGVPVNDMNDQDFYNSIDFLLVPSLSDDEPLPFIEALACGKMAITPTAGIVPACDRIEFKAGDVRDLKRVIMQVASPIYQERHRLSLQVRKYDWRYLAEEHEKIFIDLYKSHVKGRRKGSVNLPHKMTDYGGASVEALKREIGTLYARLEQMEASLERMRNSLVFRTYKKMREVLRK